ncbi:Uroporphyrinogen-III synthase [Buchnera aphidicola (Eriosoma grossulariae)]|uniref:uroporphyrinogen-III synthase n=1 Tax=Buchnera aphidicola TaxID=9 RepID=UPI0034644BC9
MKVLITRPISESIELKTILRSVGIRAWSFPILEFFPSLGLKALSKKIKIINKNDFIVITSKKAIEYSSNYLKNNYIEWPSHAEYYTIGKGSADFFKKNSGYIAKYPTKNENSETLLKIINLNQIKNKNIIILKGNRGRKLLEKTFKKNGANVILIECYQRKIKNINYKIEILKWKKNNINTLVITNNEVLQELYKIFYFLKTEKWFLKCTLLVISERLKYLAKKLGYKNIHIAKNANNQTLLKKLIEIKQQKKK